MKFLLLGTTLALTLLLSAYWTLFDTTSTTETLFQFTGVLWVLSLFGTIMYFNKNKNQK